jgi:transcriptional regulator with XRE-family HTH domain
MIDRKKLRAARCLVDWSQDDLARASGVNLSSISKFESGVVKKLNKSNEDKIREALLSQGIRFTSNGVEFIDKQALRYFKGEDSLVRFYHEIEKLLSERPNKGNRMEIWAFGVRELNFIQKLGDYTYQYAKRVEDLGDVELNVFLNPDNEILGKHASYKTLPEECRSESTVYVVGEVAAVIKWEPLEIMIIQDKELAHALGASFKLLWKLI